MILMVLLAFALEKSFTLNLYTVSGLAIFILLATYLEPPNLALYWGA